MLVVSVLHLTGTLGWSGPLAGFGLAAGPAMVVVVSRLSGHLVARIGAGPVALLAAIVYGLGPVWWFLRLDATPDYWTVFCPAWS
jgi:hypothetical protein